MTKIKRIMAGYVAAFSIFVGGISANAVEIGDSPSEVVTNTGANPNQSVVVLEDRLEEIKNDSSLSEEDRQKHIEKIEYLIEVRDSNSGVSTYTTSTYKSPYSSKILSVPHCTQKYKNYCGPATIEQTYKFLNHNDAPPQVSIGSDFNMVPNGAGCDVQPILNYLNGHLGTSYQQFWLGSNGTSFDGCTKLICESVNKGYPPVLWVTIPNDYGISRGYKYDSKGEDITKWPYIVRGHYLNASGYTKYGETMEMTDPWLSWVDDYETYGGKFDVDNFTVYKVTNVVNV
ncbi:MAG: C39 family peptidase [Oscillospiraceae bacterium]|nr:C39 family peptidase [Oscillospiraceae bacterium]